MGKEGEAGRHTETDNHGYMVLPTQENDSIHFVVSKSSHTRSSHHMMKRHFLVSLVATGHRTDGNRTTPTPREGLFLPVGLVGLSLSEEGGSLREPILTVETFAYLDEDFVTPE